LFKELEENCRDVSLSISFGKSFCNNDRSLTRSDVVEIELIVFKSSNVSVF